ncbi:MAG TPA: hypothetical protein VK988_19660 [Acidimicrobiales bacterium]|nr:hypothetical protein [Acidimicrobiales bacterium]
MIKDIYYPLLKERIAARLPGEVTADCNGKMVCSGWGLSARLILSDCAFALPLANSPRLLMSEQVIGTRVRIVAYGPCSMQAALDQLETYVGDHCEL